jgi:hypothetical protein
MACGPSSVDGAPEACRMAWRADCSEMKAKTRAARHDIRLHAHTRYPGMEPV